MLITCALVGVLNRLAAPTREGSPLELAVLRAARQRSSLLCFESPSVTRMLTPTVSCDISAQLESKVSAVNLHKDQSGKPHMNDRRLRGLAAFRGSEAKVKFAEGFEPVRMLLNDLDGLRAVGLVTTDINHEEQAS